MPELLTFLEQKLHTETDSEQRCLPAGKLAKGHYQTQAFQGLHCTAKCADTRQYDTLGPEDSLRICGQDDPCAAVFKSALHTEQIARPVIDYRDFSWHHIPAPAIRTLWRTP